VSSPALDEGRMIPVGDSSRFKSMLAFHSVLRETLFAG